VLELARRSSTESPHDMLAEASQLLSCSGREGAGAEPSGGAAGRRQALQHH